MPARRGLAALATGVVLTVTGGADRAAGESAPSPVRWGRLDASIDVATWSAGQVTGVVRVWGAHAYSHVDDSPAARAVGSPLDVGILAAAAGFKGVPYPLTSESLSPGGADKAQFAEGSRAVEGFGELKNLFSSASTTSDPPTARADGGGQAAVTPDFVASNYRATSKLIDDGRGKVAGDGIVSLDDLQFGPLAVKNITTLVDGQTDGTEAGTKLSARTLVTGANVNGVPVEIGSSGIVAADQSTGGDATAALNEQIKNVLQRAGIFDVVVAEPKTVKNEQGSFIEAGGLRVKFTPTEQMSSAVNAAVPVETAFAPGRANFLAVRPGVEDGGPADGISGGVLDSGPPFADATSSRPALPAGSSFSSAPALRSTPGSSGSGAAGADSGPTGAGALGSSDGAVAPEPSSTAAAAGAAGSAGPVHRDDQVATLPAGLLTGPSDRPWIAAVGLLSLVLFAAMAFAARKAAAAGTGPGLRQAIDSLVNPQP